MSALPDLEALVAQMKAGFFSRLMRAAQKQALTEWRDRREAPGLAARFTDAGHTFYGFGQRWGHYWLKKGSLPDFVKTGRLRDTVLKRKPKSKNAGGTDVVSRIAYGGGALNFLVNVGGITNISRVTERVPIVVAGYAYKHHKTGSIVSVAGHAATRKRIRTVVTRSSRSYADEYGDFTRDRPWIAQRVGEVFGELFKRTALTKGGQLKSKAMRGEGDA